MIISCEACKKKFIVNDNLIPAEGRQLKCNSCGHKWFFKKETFLKEKIKDQINIKKLNPDEKIPSGTQNIIKDAEKQNEEYIISSSKALIKIPFFNLFILIIITFVAFVILLDTFRISINNLVPGFNFFLDNFYESLKDLYLFFKDLIR